MSRATENREPKGSLEILEEAVHLWRAAPITTLAWYYLGALPFVLGLLYFWADMSRSPFAYQHLAGAALGLAGLFLWMKFWQAVAARQLRAALASAPQQPLTWKTCGRMFLAQTALQPSGLVLLPLALISTLPFPWVYAFYQNLGVLAEAETGELRALIKKSLRHAALWPKQNHALLTTLFLFGLFVFLNWATFCFLLPQLVKLLFGLESVFSKSGSSMLNSTFFAVVFGLTYLCVDPIAKATYTLRCFYGESVQSGQDLKAELREFAAVAQRALPWLLIIGGLAGAALQTAKAGQTQPANWVGTRSTASPASQLIGGAVERAPTRALSSFETGAGAGAVSGPQLDQAIQDVLQQRKYTWRAPREKLVEAEGTQEGLLDRFLKRVGHFLKECLKAIGRWLDHWLRRLFFRNRPAPSSGSGYGWILAQELLLGILVLAVVAGLGYLIYRVWRERRPRPGAIASEPIQTAPDLRDETVGADQLPEDGWTRLARELLARGELRLALRAFYLASLAHLAARNLISLAKFKSNRDYETELRRRGHAFPDLLVLFGQNVSVFDRTWYGLHEVAETTITTFAANVERMKGIA